MRSLNPAFSDTLRFCCVINCKVSSALDWRAPGGIASKAIRILRALRALRAKGPVRQKTRAGLLLLWTTDRGQQTEDNGQRTTDRGEQTEENGQRTTDRGQRTEENRQRAADKGQRTEDAAHDRETSTSRRTGRRIENCLQMHLLRAANAKHFTETGRETDLVGKRDAGGDKRNHRLRHPRHRLDIPFLENGGKLRWGHECPHQCLQAGRSRHGRDRQVISRFVN